MNFERRPLKTTLYSAAAVTVCISILYLWLDAPVDRFCHTLKGTDWYHAGKWLSLWANGTLWQGLSALCLVAGGLGRALNMPEAASDRLLLVGISTAVAMVIGEYTKYFFGRYRPMELIDHGLYGFTFFSTKYLQNSFPSGHTLRIFSAATALALCFPKGRIFFLIPAVLVAASRVLVCKHYPSDVLFGAFIGIFCALWTGHLLGMAVTRKNPGKSNKNL